MPRTSCVLFLLALVGCDAAPARPYVPRVQSAPEVAPVVAPGDEDREVREIRGTITGHDGAPPPFATVQVRELAVMAGASLAYPVEADGRFAVPVGDVGPIVRLQIVAVGHPVLEVPVDLRDLDSVFDIRLGGPEEPIESVKAHLARAMPEPDAWNGSTPGSVVRGDVLPAVDLQRGADGVFTASVAAAEPGVLYTFAGPGTHYKFGDLGAVGRPLPLPLDAEQPRYDGFLQWAFAPARDGRVELRLDPATLGPPGRAPVIVTLGDAPWTAALVRADAVARAWGPAVHGLPPADAATCARAAADARGIEDMEGVARWMHYVEFASSRGCELAAADVRRALQWLDPADVLWGLHQGALMMTVQPLRERAADRPLVDEFLDAVVERQADANVVADVLMARLEAEQDRERARELFKTLKQPRFERTLAAMFAASLDPDRIDAGDPVPEFSVPAVDGGPPITRESLLGAPYVLEFWGTWCSPCVEGMPELHAGYAKVNGLRAPADVAGWRTVVAPARPNVEFVTISVHEPAGAVAEFRRTQWPMPWKNGAAGETDSTALMAKFSVSGVPSTFFVDAAGTLVQREGELAAGLRKLGGRRR